MKQKAKGILIMAVIAVFVLSKCGSKKPDENVSEQATESIATEAAQSSEAEQSVETEASEKETESTENTSRTKEAENSEEKADAKDYDLFKPTMDVEVQGEEGWPEFKIKTNLPDKTTLTLTLSDEYYYDEQQTATVENGEAISKKFKEEGGVRLSGDYTLVVVMMPEEQNGAIKEIVGEAGDKLDGELIETSSSGKYVHFETTYTSECAKEEIESTTADSKQYSLEEIALMIEKDIIMNMDGTGIDYTVKADDGGINVTFYSDDFTLVAAAAKLGDNDSLKEWENMTEGIKAMSERLQKNYVEEAGYTDKFVVVNIAPDKKSDKVFYQAASGKVLYDTVSDK